MMQETTPQIPSLDMLSNAVATICWVNVEDIKGKRRVNSIVLARSLFCFIAHERCNVSYPEIATYLGRDGHSTVWGAAYRMKLMIERKELIVLAHNYRITNAEQLYDTVIEFLDKQCGKQEDAN